ncbi:unnamed protein product [Phyllotreta striolata]|uniref:Uncharacterized protein n=1 Tax=Phyllotreta striolata TaxID=444603 RepID=A0A9N9TNG2_PHYSR|nr:unnamed protein product [Phyllotreta striolata]
MVKILKKYSKMEVENADLPQHIAINSFATARAREIQVMNKALATSTTVKLAFQKLPMHMRRRAMSHNVKRLPRRVREIHLNQQMKSGIPPKHKRPSRKYRRRPYNLINEYTRRQRRVGWLNTHIWHAKRFHMTEKWGYRIPYSPCDKAFRACYRATKQHCLVQDISYNNCLEIEGDFDYIVENLNRMTDPRTGLSISAKCYTGGLREGNAILFRPDNRKVIGSVSFYWRPKSNDSNTRNICFWCHPAFYDELLNIFIKCCELQPCTSANDTGDVDKYANSQITLKILKWELCRFRLTGPLSNAILHDAFKLPDNSPMQPEWLRTHLNNPLSATSREFWESTECISSPSEVTPHIILPLIIADPRYYFTKKRGKVLPVLTEDTMNSSMSTNFSESPIWEETVRQAVRESKISNAKLDELRQQLLVPGTILDMVPANIPVLLIQVPGKKTREYTGYGSGWDIVFPSAWAQPIWLSLVMRGGRSGGLRQHEHLLFELDSHRFLYPDSSSGEQEERDASLKLKERYFKLPPNKRTNFAKFKISSPFDWNWKLLLSEWSVTKNPIEDFFVLRDKTALRDLQVMLSRRDRNDRLLESLEDNCLIPVKVTLMKKGCCQRFSIICVPRREDFKAEPCEPNCNDPNESARKLMRKEHKVLLARLKRKRKKGRRKGEVIPIDKEALKSYTSAMRKLWLPEASRIRSSCSREVMGFVKYGDFSLLEAKSKALGYITANSLSVLLNTGKNKVLVRNTNSKQYRLGTLEILNE